MYKLALIYFALSLKNRTFAIISKAHFMKEFIKYTLATIVGIILFSILMGGFAIASLAGMMASMNTATPVKDNSVLVLNLSGMMQERSSESTLSALMSDTNTALGLDDMLTAVKKAKGDKRIKGIYIEAGMFTADSYASMQALRNALLDFKKSGKWIVAYGDTYTQGTYYLASVANELVLNPQGQIDWHGIAAQHFFLKDMLAKVGVKVQLAKVGAYKSAPEMFTAEKMSDANRHQVQVYIDGLWQNVCKAVADSRHLSTERLNNYADSLITFADPKEYISMKMADKLLYTDEVKDLVKQWLKIGKDEDVNQVSVSDMLAANDEESNGEEIAVYYAVGDVVSGNLGGGLTGGDNVIDAQAVCKDLEKLASDDDVKAVVLRINTGGGSAYASEQIWHSLKRLKAVKPVVVSMGGMTASGGYYISSIANWIVAQPTTLTGSIGIFGMFPDMSGLLTEKLGVKFDEVKTNRNAGFGTPARPFNDEEMAYLNTYIDRGYRLFRSRVAEGRHMTDTQVERIAQGRVWLGQDAIKIGLVDQLGGLDEAVEKAAQLAKIKEYHTTDYPGKVSWIDNLTDKIAGGNYLEDQMKTTLGEYYDTFMLLKRINRKEAIQARVPFVINMR